MGTPWGTLQHRHHHLSPGLDGSRNINHPHRAWSKTPHQQSLPNGTTCNRTSPPSPTQHRTQLSHHPSAVTTIYNMSTLSKVGIKNNHPLFKTIHYILTANPNIQLKWCKAHPDITLQDSWTHQQWGNHLADLVAGGESLPTHLININSSETISATEVATRIQTSSYWSHADANTLILTDISMMPEKAGGTTTNLTVTHHTP